ncbi:MULTISPECIES: hypothetical protein [unclassified Leisingera]|uniref:hypothetical protein n=1 Tax=unclassified Leisingera TaxID=2614906 RepID=UPI000377AF0E|nr:MULTISPECIES: hypothetical protein [unclassified Leisingera]KIC54499.1 hypothetical protein RA22_07650 [Leisingera sp. ANG-S]KID10680.1 hypothetical protein GC1_03105 [Leisingera sp. ANG1]
MISTHTVKVGRKTHKLKASTLAQARLEQLQGGKPIGDLLEHLIDGSGGVNLVIDAWAAFLDDGKGVEREEAAKILDALGGANAAAVHLGECLSIAFPFLKAEEGEEAEEEDDAGNAKSPAA